MISFARVAVGDGGFVGCTRCDPTAPARRYFSAQEIIGSVRSVADAWKDGPGPNVSLAGTEPFGHAELPAIIAGAVALGMQRICLRTDGGALSVDGNARGAVHAGVRQIELVVLGDLAVHDELAATPGLFVAARQGARAFLDAARDARVPAALTAMLPVCRHNIAALPGAVALLAEMGAVAVELDVAESAQRAVGYRKWVSAALETGMVNGVWVYVRRADAPLASDARLHAVAPCGVWLG